jgi:methylmalonyl-CoA mutase, N-terminal domain
MIDGCFDYFDKIDGFGGMVEAVEAGFPQREIQESAYQYQKAVERKEQIIVGVNKYAMDIESTKPTFCKLTKPSAIISSKVCRNENNARQRRGRECSRKTQKRRER